MNYSWLRTMIHRAPQCESFLTVMVSLWWQFISLYCFALLAEDVSPNQMHQVTLDPVEEVKLTWMVDWPEKNVFFQVKNGINDRFTWFAIGFSRRGEFPRTDFCIFQKEDEKIDINIVSNKSFTLPPKRPHSFYKLDTLKGFSDGAVDVKLDLFMKRPHHRRWFSSTSTIPIFRMRGQVTMDGK